MPDDSQVTSPAAPEPSARCPEAALCRRAWDGLWEALLALPDPAFDEPSGCAGWRVRDLAVHLIIGAEDVLITLATPAAPPATADAAGYWEVVPPPDGEDPLDALLPRLATAYGDPALLRHHLEDLGAAAHRGLAEAPPERLRPARAGHRPLPAGGAGARRCPAGGHRPPGPDLGAAGAARAAAR